MSVFDLIGQLPDIDTVRDRCRSIAMLDAVLSPDWEFRYYSFNSRWGAGEAMASMRDGGGTGYSIVFSSAGAYARGFDRESAMTPYRVKPAAPWSGLFTDVPQVFRSAIEEPAFGDENGTQMATVCFWRETADPEWRTGTIDLPAGSDDPDGASAMFTILTDSSGELYRHFAGEYYERDVDMAAVEHIYRLQPLTQTVVKTLNPDIKLKQLADDIAEIDYPS